MGELFRSATMNYVKMTVPRDAVFEVFAKLGDLGCVHFLDLNTPEAPSDINVRAKKRLTECAALQTRLGFFETQLTNLAIELPPPIPHTPAIRPRRRPIDVVRELMVFLEPLEEDLRRDLSFKADNAMQMNRLQEHLYVLELVHKISVKEGGIAGVTSNEPLDEPLLDQADSAARDQRLGGERNLRCLAGVIPFGRHLRFERMLFRASRSKIYMRTEPIEEQLLDPDSGKPVSKLVFCVYFIGEHLENKIKKMCDGFQATLYPLSEVAQIPREIQGIQVKLKEKKEVLSRTTLSLENLLRRVAFGEKRARQMLAAAANAAASSSSSSASSMPSSSSSAAGALGIMSSPRPQMLEDDVEMEEEGGAAAGGGVPADGSEEDEEESMSRNSPLRAWQDELRKEVNLCNGLKNCISDRNFIHCEGWLPRNKIDTLRTELQLLTAAKQQPVGLFFPAFTAKPPTLIPTGKITRMFQDLVDTYGVPRYKEVNAGVFTIISFPFLFGIMYGDVGHALLVLAAALYFILAEKSLQQQIRRGTLSDLLSMAYQGRYLLFVMSLFALYCGSLYNDWFSLGANIYGSRWTAPYVDPLTNHTIPAVRQGVYPWGMDPMWHGKKNQLLFYNSFKMKVSVGIGVAQMLLGTFMSALNHIYFRDWLSFCCEFIPELLFMLCSFGYMVWMIFYKFVVAETSAPNLITTTMNMFLHPFSLLPENTLYGGQRVFQGFLVLICLFTVPIMLFTKPCVGLYRSKHEKRVLEAGKHAAGAEGAPKPYSPLKSHSPDEERKDVVGVAMELGGQAVSNFGGPLKAQAPEPEPFSFGDAFIHQAIHTIEYVLGCISHTASYLRLWALSLAHAELAAVFWEQIMVRCINMGNPVVVVAAFTIWLCVTIGVLCLMDVLECFLHALRLHWVEFQSKFFYADGYAFEPFAFYDELGMQLN